MANVTSLMKRIASLNETLKRLYAFREEAGGDDMDTLAVDQQIQKHEELLSLAEDELERVTELASGPKVRTHGSEP